MILHITPQGYADARRNGLIDEFGMVPLQEARRNRNRKEKKVEQLVCPCNQISNIPQVCPYHTNLNRY